MSSGGGRVPVHGGPVAKVKATGVGSVSDVRRLARRARQMLELNKTLVERTTTGDTRRGRQLWVYGKRGGPCPRCGTPVRRDEMGPEGQERVVYWCPSCQPER